MAGFAITIGPLVVFNLVAGLHVYVVALPPVNVVELPEHIVAGPATAVKVGGALTVTVSVKGVVAAQPNADVPFSVYVMVLVGLAVTDEPVLAFNDVLGVQV